MQRLRAAYPVEFDELLAAWLSVQADPDPPARLFEKLSGTNTAGLRLRVAARQVIKIWYLLTIDDPSAQLAQDGNVQYLHTKYMLVDPLGANPLLVSASANFSEGSDTNNDENMLIMEASRALPIFISANSCASTATSHFATGLRNTRTLMR